MSKIEEELASVREMGRYLVQVNTERFEAQKKCAEENERLEAKIEILERKLKTALWGCESPRDCIGYLKEQEAFTEWQCGRCAALHQLMEDK